MVWHERHGIKFKYRKLNIATIDSEYHPNGNSRELQYILRNSKASIYEVSFKNQDIRTSLVYDNYDEETEISDIRWIENNVHLVHLGQKKIVVISSRKNLIDIYVGRDFNDRDINFMKSEDMPLDMNKLFNVVGKHCLGNINKRIISKEEIDIVIEAINKYYSTKYER